jgi:hypothetical protein
MAERSKSIGQRIKTYQALGYLCLTIDKLVLNAQKDEITQATLDLEKRLELMKAPSP